MSYAPDNRGPPKGRPAGEYGSGERGNWGDNGPRRNWESGSDRPPSDRYPRDFPRSPSPKRRKGEPEPNDLDRRYGSSPSRSYNGDDSSSGDWRGRDSSYASSSAPRDSQGSSYIPYARGSSHGPPPPGYDSYAPRDRTPSRPYSGDLNRSDPRNDYRPSAPGGDAGRSGPNDYGSRGEMRSYSRPPARSDAPSSLSRGYERDSRDLPPPHGMMRDSRDLAPPPAHLPPSQPPSNGPPPPHHHSSYPHPPPVSHHRSSYAADDRSPPPLQPHSSSYRADRPPMRYDGGRDYRGDVPYPPPHEMDSYGHPLPPPPSYDSGDYGRDSYRGDRHMQPYPPSHLGPPPPHAHPSDSHGFMSAQSPPPRRSADDRYAPPHLDSSSSEMRGSSSYARDSRDSRGDYRDSRDAREPRDTRDSGNNRPLSSSHKGSPRTGANADLSSSSATPKDTLEKGSTNSNNGSNSSSATTTTAAAPVTNAKESLSSSTNTATSGSSARSSSSSSSTASSSILPRRQNEDSPHRMGARQDPSGGRPPLEQRQQSYSRPSILGNQQQQSHQQPPPHHYHPRPSITAPMRQFDSPNSRRMDGLGRRDYGDSRSDFHPHHYDRTNTPNNYSSSYSNRSSSYYSKSGASSSTATSDSTSAARSGTSSTSQTNTDQQNTAGDGASMKVTGESVPIVSPSPLASSSSSTTTVFDGASQMSGQTNMQTQSGFEPSSAAATPAVDYASVLASLPSQVELICGIEDKDSELTEVSKQLEALRKEREKLAKDVQATENSKNRGKLLHLVSGLPIRPEILSMNSADLIKETYEHNLKLSTRSDDALTAQLWDPTIRPKYAPFLNYLKSTSKQFRYLSIAAQNEKLAKSTALQMSTPAPTPSSASNSQTPSVDVKKEGNDVSTQVQGTENPSEIASTPSTNASQASSHPASASMEESNPNGMQVDAPQAELTASGAILRSSSPAQPVSQPTVASGSEEEDVVVVDQDFLPALEAGVEGPREIDERTFFEAVAPVKVSDYSFYKDNQVLHAQLRESMIASLQEKRAEVIQKTTQMAKAHRKATLAWYRRLQVEKEEEATKRLLGNKKWLHVAQSGRKFSVRATTRAAEMDSPSSSRRRGVMTSSGGMSSGGSGGGGGFMDDEYDEEEDEERFEATRAEVPPMLQFDEWASDHRRDMIDNNGAVEDSRQVDQDIKIMRPWYPEEEEVFVRAFLGFHKDFARIQALLPTKSLQEVIWFYYTRKHKLDLKRKYQREGVNHQQLMSLGLSALDSTDPAAATLAHYMGSAVEWVNGASRRGSLRLMEKGTKPPPPGSAGSLAAAPSPYPTASAASTYATTSMMSADKHHRILEEPDMEVDTRSLHDSGNYSPGRQTASGAFGETQNRWTAEEREKFKAAFDTYYKDFKAIAEVMRTKNAAQCKNYYHNNKKKLGLPSSLTRAGTTAVTAASLTNPPDASTTPSPTTVNSAYASKNATGEIPDLNEGEQSQNGDSPRLTNSSSSLPAPSLRISVDAVLSANAAMAATASVSIANEGATDSPDDDLKSSLELAAPTPKRGVPARVNTSHWADDEKQKFKALLQVHGKDWKSLAAGIPSKTVNQIKNFFQNYRSKLKLDDLLPESDRNAGSTRGGRGKKRKLKPRGRPKKSAAGGSESPFEDDGSDYGEDSDGEGGGAGSDSEVDGEASNAAPATGSDDEEDALPQARTGSGKRKHSDTEEALEADENANQEDDETAAEEMPLAKAVAASAHPGTPSKRGRGGSRGGRGRGGSIGKTATATPPPAKKRKLSPIPVEPNNSDGGDGGDGGDESAQDSPAAEE